MERISAYRHDGLTFDVDDGGEGDVVILLHGFPQNRAAWRPVTPRLVDAGYRVIAPDQRGYSPAARPSRRSRYSLRRLAADILALANRVEADRFHVVGHDWGGAVAWTLAARHPGRVASVTSLATPHPRAFTTAMFTGGQAARSWYMAAFQLPWLPEILLRSNGGGRRFLRALVDSGLPEPAAEASLQLLRNGAASGALNWYRALPFGDARNSERVRVPTLYVYGPDDIALGQTAANLTGRFVDAPYHYEMIDGCGHWLIEQAGPTVADLVAGHLRRHPA